MVATEASLGDVAEADQTFFIYGKGPIEMRLGRAGRLNSYMSAKEPGFPSLGVTFLWLLLFLAPTTASQHYGFLNLDRVVPGVDTIRSPSIACPFAETLKVYLSSGDSNLWNLAQIVMAEWNNKLQPVIKKPVFTPTTSYSDADISLSFVTSTGTSALGYEQHQPTSYDGCFRPKTQVVISYGSTDAYGRWELMCDRAILEILRHEIGHALLFDHSSDQTLYMYHSLDVKSLCISNPGTQTQTGAASTPTVARGENPNPKLYTPSPKQPGFGLIPGLGALIAIFLAFAYRTRRQVR